ncbi:cytochrome P450 [Calocera cornea HHB12733]|uniref:Cytochrome P450 n=1 Tax=Calocera cornea HHB12733 TaxID=1353952 RepID=A0A165J7E0_9BASI|nr:cytochrome P450 [Calocera cornea HHB12733]
MEIGLLERLLSIDWSLGHALLLLGLVLALYTLFHARQFCKRFGTPLRHLPGPQAASMFWGNSLQMIGTDGIEESWIREFGRTYVTPVMFGSYRLNTTDPRAVAHVLSHVDNYPKPEYTRGLLGSVTGQGLFIAEGEDHKRQKRVMNPSFSPGHIRDVTPIFFATSNHLRDVLDRNLPSGLDMKELDIYTYAGRASLDIIGEAGFGYRFNSLDDADNELWSALHDMMSVMGAHPVTGQLRCQLKWFRSVPIKINRVMKDSLKTVQRIGMDLVRVKKDAVQREMESKHVGKNSIVGKDILSALVRSNMAVDLAASHRMSDAEVMAQISTMVAAGHESTAVTLSWTLLKLGENPEMQNKLREELALVPEDTPSMDILNELPYLDMVIKESLRLCPPVPYTTRTALHDDTLPLIHPVMDKYGKVHESINIRAGDFVGIQIKAMNKSTELWGSDANEFRPERWSEDIGPAGQIPGIWAHMLTFIGGPRACIGYKFSIIELKALLFALIRSFEFASVPGKEIGAKPVVVDRPFVKGEESRGFQLPLLVKRIEKAS